MSCGSSEAYVTVFKPASPGKDDGPRIWNDQLLQYASYNNKGDVVGDPKNVSVYYYMLSYFVIPYLYLVFLTIHTFEFIQLRFTEMLTERFGWTGPPDGKQGSHDYVSASNCFYCCHNPMALMYNYHSNLSFVVSLCVYSSHLSCSSIRMSLQSCLRFHSSVHLQFTFTTLSIQHWHLSE